MSLLSVLTAAISPISAIRQSGRRLPVVWRPMIVVLVLGALAGCTDVPDDPEGRGNIRAVHAISNLGTVSFLIEERSLTTPAYQTTTPYSTFDSLVYDFNFDFSSGLSGQVERLATTEISVRPDVDYTVVLSGTAQAPTVTTLSQPRRVFADSDTILELWFGNLSANAPNVDIYVGAAGFDPAAQAPLVAGLSRDSFSALSDIEEGAYEFVVTPAGDAATVLLRTEPVTLIARDTALMNFLDAAGETTGDHVLVIGGLANGGRLVDQSAPVEVQLFNGSLASGAVDVYVDDETVTPLLANRAFGTLSASVPIPEADDGQSVDLVVTAAGNVGAPLSTTASIFSDSSSNLLVYTGSAASDTLRLQNIAINRRSLFDIARLGVFNASSSVERIDFYLVPSSTTFADSTPRANAVPPATDLTQLLLPADSYEVYVTNDADDAIVAGPIPLSIAVGDIRQLVIVDTADPNVLDVLAFDPLMP